MKLNATVHESIGASVLCWLATADTDGFPNVSPKEIFAAFGDDEIIVASIASPVTAANIAANPKVCISFVDVFRQKGFKIKGLADSLDPSHAGFAARAATLQALAGPKFEITSLHRIKIARISRILAPSYSQYPETDEAEMIASAYATYRVTPVE